MRFGVSCDLHSAPALQKAGYDYMESNAQVLAQMSETEFSEVRALLEKTGLACEAINCLFHGENHRLVGESLNLDTLQTHLEGIFDRAVSLGCKIAVVGSGAARRIPDGYPVDKAFAEFSQVLAIAGDIAGERGITMALEPLCRNETNLINTVAEGLALVKKLNHPHVALLADFYHMAENGEDCEGMIAAEKLLIHTHIAAPGSRDFPSPAQNPEAYAPFFTALAQNGCVGRLSAEANNLVGDFEKNIAETLELMKSFLGEHL